MHECTRHGQLSDDDEQPSPERDLVSEAKIQNPFHSLYIAITIYRAFSSARPIADTTRENVPEKNLNTLIIKILQFILLLDGNKFINTFLILLPDGNIFFILKFDEMIDQSPVLYFDVIIGNIIQLIHEDV